MFLTSFLPTTINFISKTSSSYIMLIILGCIISYLLLVMYLIFFRESFKNRKSLNLIKVDPGKKNLPDGMDFFNKNKANIFKSTKFVVEGTEKRLNIIDMGNGSVLVIEEGVFDENNPDSVLMNDIVNSFDVVDPEVLADNDLEPGVDAVQMETILEASEVVEAEVESFPSDQTDFDQLHDLLTSDDIENESDFNEVKDSSDENANLFSDSDPE